MTDVSADGDRDARVVSLRQDNVRTELSAQNAMNSLGLSGAAMDRIAQGITAEVLYAFAVDWSPDLVKPGGVHSWESDGAFFARCSVCLVDSPPSASREAA